jgi:hypothetical protein
MGGIAKIHILMFLEKILYVSAVGFFLLQNNKTDYSISVFH